MPTRTFADLSNNNAVNVNWPPYRKSGHILVLLKATEGESFIDQTHGGRAVHARAAGIHPGHYHFAHCDSSPIQQAQFFWSIVRPVFRGWDPLVLDVEQGGQNGKSVQECAHWTTAFDVEFRKVSGGHELILYSDASFLSELVRAGAHVQGTRAWIAAYGSEPPAPKGWSKWGHQFTDGEAGPLPHSCAGIGQCDVSTLNPKSYLGLLAHRP